jgi:copper resistance protein B
VIASLFARHRIVAAFLAAIFVLTLAAGSASAQSTSDSTTDATHPQSAPTSTTDTQQPSAASWPPPWGPPVHDNGILYYANFNELETRLTGAYPTFRWDSEGYIGDANNKFWVKSEGSLTNGVMSDGDQEFLYDRPIPRVRYFDFQVGVRADLDAGPTRTWGAIGIQGMAPYFFDFEPTLYIRGDGHVAGRIEGSCNLFITQHLILQPQAELNFYSKDDLARGIGSGLSDIDTGVRIGYQITRKFAPYVGFTYASGFGNTANLARQAGAPTHDSSFVVGIWVWR